MMDKNVMNTYKSVAKEPKHHVQYDQVEDDGLDFDDHDVQGEDRWLCTLMLKQGWRVEYSAASDSFTACPEVVMVMVDFIFLCRASRSSTTRGDGGCPHILLNIADLIGDYKQARVNSVSSKSGQK